MALGFTGQSKQKRKAPNAVKTVNIRKIGSGRLITSISLVTIKTVSNPYTNCLFQDASTRAAISRTKEMPTTIKFTITHVSGLPRYSKDNAATNVLKNNPAEKGRTARNRQRSEPFNTCRLR